MDVRGRQKGPGKRQSRLAGERESNSFLLIQPIARYRGLTTGTCAKRIGLPFLCIEKLPSNGISRVIPYHPYIPLHLLGCSSS